MKRKKMKKKPAFVGYAQGQRVNCPYGNALYEGCEVLDVKTRGGRRVYRIYFPHDDTNVEEVSEDVLSPFTKPKPKRKVPASQPKRTTRTPDGRYTIYWEF